MITESLNNGTEERFDEADSYHVRQFGEMLIAADTASCVSAAESEINGLVGLDEADDPRGRSLSALVRAATSAGILIGRPSEKNYALAMMAATEQLDDDGRERTGYAIHTISRAKEQGTPVPELADYAGRILDAYAQQKTEQFGEAGPDNNEMAVAAFAVGACIEDKSAAGKLQDRLNQMIVARTSVIEEYLTNI